MSSEPKAVAEAKAREQFVKDQRRWKVEDYDVRITERPHAFEVTFFPRVPPRRPVSPQDSVPLFGAFHYFIEKNTYRLIRRQLER